MRREREIGVYISLIFSSKPGRYFSYNQALLSTAYLFFFSRSYLISSPIISCFETKFAGSSEKDLSL